MATTTLWTKKPLVLATPEEVWAFTEFPRRFKGRILTLETHPMILIGTLRNYLGTDVWFHDRLRVCYRPHWWQWWTYGASKWFDASINIHVPRSKGSRVYSDFRRSSFARAVNGRTRRLGRSRTNLACAMRSHASAAASKILGW